MPTQISWVLGQLGGPDRSTYRARAASRVSAAEGGSLVGRGGQVRAETI